jgi:hypothetical protein
MIAIRLSVVLHGFMLPGAGNIGWMMYVNTDLKAATIFGGVRVHVGY